MPKTNPIATHGESATAGAIAAGQTTWPIATERLVPSVPSSLPAVDKVHGFASVVAKKIEKRGEAAFVPLAESKEKTEVVNSDKAYLDRNFVSKLPGIWTGAKGVLYATVPLRTKS